MTKQLDRVVSVALQPWALTPPMVSIVARVLGMRLAGEAAELGSFEKRPAPPAAPGGAVAVIPIHGVIAPRMNLLSDVSGGATFEAASEALAQAVARPDVSTIVFDIDSPGGSVLGATEFAREVLKARTTKRIVAQANYEMCSAAYWIGACASEIVASPSSVLGAIGVYSIHEDLSALLEQMGVKLTLISAGKYKVDGHEAAPLSDSARDRLQALVDAAYARFVGDVAKGRGCTEADIRGGFGQGAVVSTDEALALGMIDRVGTFDDTLSRLLPAGATRPQLATVTTPAPSDTPQEPSRATGQDRIAQQRALQRSLVALGL